MSEENPKVLYSQKMPKYKMPDFTDPDEDLDEFYAGQEHQLNQENRFLQKGRKRNNQIFQNSMNAVAAEHDARTLKIEGKSEEDDENIKEEALNNEFRQRRDARMEANQGQPAAAAAPLNFNIFEDPDESKITLKGGIHKSRSRGRARGRARGRTRGRTRGHTGGRARGRSRGRARGRARGRSRGRARGRSRGRH